MVDLSVCRKSFFDKLSKFCNLQKVAKLMIKQAKEVYAYPQLSWTESAPEWCLHKIWDTTAMRILSAYLGGLELCIYLCQGAIVIITVPAFFASLTVTLLEQLH